MDESLIFSGTGLALGNYAVTNDDILKFLRCGYLTGFNEMRAAKSDNFSKYQQTHPNATAFDYMAEAKMGFRKRFHVVPFPPNASQYKNAENTISLCVKAVEEALKKSQLSGNEIDAWFVGTATSVQRAPSIAEFVKAYFTNTDNNAPTFSSTSACVGFNANLEAAVAYFYSHPEANHILVAHSEVMSKLLLEEHDFVPFTTFGDSAAAVIISKVETKEKCGIVAICNNEDLAMLDFLGADKNGNLFMEPRMVKNRAVPNITNTAKKLLAECNWQINDLAMFIPHQTGNAIVHAVADNLGIDKSLVYQEVQFECGNLSGASVPACFDRLFSENRLKPNDKILTAVAGLGGEFGGFAYIVPPENVQFATTAELVGKKVMISGATGGIGSKIAELAAKRGAELILLYNSNLQTANKLKEKLQTDYNTKVSLYQVDLSNEQNAIFQLEAIKQEHTNINYLVCTHAVTGGLARATQIGISDYEEVMQVNYLSVKNLCLEMKDAISEAVLITGSVGEDAQFAGSAPYVSSKRALRSFARHFASTIYNKGVKCVYYLPGVVNGGMVSKLNAEQRQASLATIGQKELTEVDDISERMLNSLCRLKVPNTRISFETKLTVIKDVYLNY